MNKKDITKAIQNLQKGEVIVYPTDTLYALGADIYNIKAVKKIFKIKKRPYSLPLPIAVSNIEMIKEIAKVDANSKKIIKNFLPGPLTLVLIKKKHISKLITSGKNTIAIRIPDNEIALDLISKYGPLTATSANVHGKKTPYIINKINMQFKQEKLKTYLDVGKLNGKPSTIIDLTKNKIKILRKGPITENEIMEVIKKDGR